MSKTTIDLTPKWRAVMGAYVRVLTEGNAEGQHIARDELLNVGKWLDEFNTMEWGKILRAADASDDDDVRTAVATVREWFASDEEQS
jgi:hypothetical protein